VFKVTAFTIFRNGRIRLTLPEQPACTYITGGPTTPRLSYVWPLNMPLLLSRQFSRYGVGLLKLSQEQSILKSHSSDLIYKSAVLLAFFGVGFSMYSASHLQDSRGRSPRGKH
ncbi:hypothetical protein LSH36_47g00025, partial [Paralvinella palmiformis]